MKNKISFPDYSKIAMVTKTLVRSGTITREVAQLMLNNIANSYNFTPIYI